MRVLLKSIFLLVCIFSSFYTKAEKAPVLIGFDGAYGQKTNTAAKAIEFGVQIAIDEINSSGGVLNGRPLKLVTTDNKGVSARGKDNFVELAQKKDLVAVLGGKYSPITVETIPDAQRLKVPLISVWGSADQITEHGFKPSYVFRVSLKDSWGVEAMIKRISQSLQATNACAFLPNTAWGRSSDAVIKSKSAAHNVNFSSIRWYNWGDSSFKQHYSECLSNNGKAILFVGNEKEGAILFREIASMPPEKRLPVVSHWGVSGGAIHQLAGDALAKIRVDVIQTFSFIENNRSKAISLGKAAMIKYKFSKFEEIPSPVGVAQAYDATYLIKLAIDSARSTDRVLIRNALENLTNYDGAIRDYIKPFSQDSHDALTENDVLFVNIRPNGTLIPIR